MGIKIINIDCHYSNSILTYQLKLQYKEHEELFYTVVERETLTGITTSIARFVLDKLAVTVNTWKSDIDSGKLKPNKEIVFSTSFQALLDSLDESHTWKPAFERIVARKSRCFEGNYYTLNKEGLVSFCPDGKKQEFNEDGTWKKTNRNTIKPVKWLARLLKTAGSVALTTRESDLWASVCSAVGGDSTIKESEVLADIYNMTHSDRNTIGDSCMRGDGHLYQSIQHIVSPVKLRIAYRTDPEHSKRLVGRALLWEIDGDTYMDRIYSDSNTTEAYFKNYAQERGFFYREKQSNSYVSSWISPTGAKVEKILDIVINPECFGDEVDVPYMDTFRWIYQDGDELILTNDEGNSKERDFRYTLSNTEGCLYDTDDGCVNTINLND